METMINYIKAELYRSFNRVYYWNSIIFTSILGMLASISIKTNSLDNMGLVALMYLGIRVISMPVFLVVFFIDMITSEENKNLTLKNVVTSGLHRNKIILSKIAATIILSVIAAIIILTVYLGTGWIFLGLGDNFSIEIAKDFFLRILAAVPLWTGAIAVGTLIALVFKNNTVFSFVYAGIFLILGNIIKALSYVISDKFMYIYKILITTNLTNLAGDVVTNSTLIFAAIVGLSFTVIFTIFSVLYFNKMELK